MKAGAERKKVIALAVLGVVAAALLYFNVFSSSSDNGPAPVRRASAPAAPQAVAPRAGTTRRSANSRTSSGDFKPVFGWKRPEDKPDMSTIDPTLKLDLLAKVQSVGLEGGNRNLFQFSTAPPPPTPANLPKVDKIAVNGKPGEAPANTEPAGPPKPPPPPPINLKYYGYSTVRGGDGRKRAFFLDGDDIIVAGEGETVKKRYKVVRIGVNSVVMEDTQFKDTQTLPLAPEAVV